MEGIFDNYSVKRQIINSGYVIKLFLPYLPNNFLNPNRFFFGADPSSRHSYCLWMKWSGLAATWGNQPNTFPPCRWVFCFMGDITHFVWLFCLSIFSLCLVVRWVKCPEVLLVCSSLTVTDFTCNLCHCHLCRPDDLGISMCSCFHVICSHVELSGMHQNLFGELSITHLLWLCKKRG